MDEVGTPVSIGGTSEISPASASAATQAPATTELHQRQDGGSLAAPAAAAFGAAEAPVPEGHKKRRAKVLVPTSTLDLEQYAANYKDRAVRIERLLFVADRCPQLQVEAYTMALKELAQTSNVDKYSAIAQKLNDVLAVQRLPAFVPDTKWADATLKASHAKSEQLENELRMYKASMIKESTRMGFSDLGDHYAQTGAISNAFKNYIRVKDYCTTRKHIIDMCFKVIQTSIAMGNFSQAQTFVNKAESVEDLPDKDKVNARLHSVQGVINLESGSYRKACRNFLDVRFEHADVLIENISPNDVAIYVSILALATFDRAELRSKVIENSNFKPFLELEPQIREALHSFNALKFQTCLDILGKIKNELCLDMYLNEHVETLYQQIRKKAIMQYFYPYQTVRLEKMAASFGVSMSNLEREVVGLIGEGQLQARIDSHNKVLRATRTDDRSRLYAQVRMLVGEHAFASRMSVLRARMIERGLMVGSGSGSGDDGESAPAVTTGPGMAGVAMRH